MSFFRLMSRAGALAAAVAVAGRAQQPSPPAEHGMDHAQMERMHHGPGGMTGGAMGRGGPGHAAQMAAGPASHLLVMRQELGLSDEQVRRLEALKTAQAQALQPPRAAAMRARADLLDATKGDGDLGASKRALDRLAQLRVDAMMARLKARQEARAVLTADQKTRFDALVQQHRGRGGMPGGWRMGRGGPGMGGRMGPGGGGRRGMAPPGMPVPPAEDLDLDLDLDEDLPPR